MASGPCYYCSWFINYRVDRKKRFMKAPALIPCIYKGELQVPFSLPVTFCYFFSFPLSSCQSIAFRVNSAVITRVIHCCVAKARNGKIKCNERSAAEEDNGFLIFIFEDSRRYNDFLSQLWPRNNTLQWRGVILKW